VPSARFEWSLRSGASLPEGWRVTPGAPLEGRVTITPSAGMACNNIFLRLRWHTEGRGTRDGQTAAEMSVFQGVLAAEQPAVLPFRLTAPEKPWSYNGRHIRILWNLEADIDLPMALNPKSQFPLILRPAGSVPR
jgi:hypothetical protein